VRQRSYASTITGHENVASPLNVEDIAWADRISNEEVLRRAGANRDLISTIVVRQIRFVENMVRKEIVKEVSLLPVV